MRVLGLTGSIAMGKSTAALLLRRMRVPVYDADAAIHALLARGGAGVAPVAAAFPGCVRGGAVDRAALGARVFGDPAALARLEAILHPLARAGRAAFLATHMRARTKLVCLDVPLLYETMGETTCDLVVVVSASATIQRMRALARPGMDERRLAAILARQMPDAKKRVLADIVAVTALGRLPTLRALRKAARLALSRPSRRRPH